MESALRQYEDRLKSKKISSTKPRKAVFKALFNSGHTPLSTSELIKLCETGADRASIYRSIDRLESAGIIKRVNHGFKYKLELSDEFHGHHHHIACTKCGGLLAIPDSLKLEIAINEMAEAQGYQATSHQIEIYGLCPYCQEK